MCRERSRPRAVAANSRHAAAIDDAVHESLDSIGEALRGNGGVLVTGCLGAQPVKILERHPEVLGITGPHAYEEVLSVVHEHLPQPHDPYLDLVPPQGIKLTPSHYAYLKISEGCDRTCTFCAIPKMRGKHATKPIEEVVREARELAADGVKEPFAWVALAATSGGVARLLRTLRVDCPGASRTEARTLPSSPRPRHRTRRTTFPSPGW